jgi:uncharacterized Zn finger protein (UPF0148 family)
MICSHCGAPLKNGSLYCDSCGQLSQAEEEIAPKQPQVVQKRPMPLWFKIVSALAVIALIVVTAGILLTENLRRPIDGQLAALRANDLDKAYFSYTSKDFQNTTSLDNFREFIDSFPAFLKSKALNISQRTSENSIRTLTGSLVTVDDESFSVEYRLIKENGKWKILSIRLLDAIETVPTGLVFVDANETDQLLKPIDKQLHFLQEGQIKEAYEETSSQEFKRSTSFEAFQEFLKNYPVFETHQKIEFHTPAKVQEKGSINATLHMDNIQWPVNYDLIKEDGQWKIWSMRISIPPEEAAEKKERDEKTIVEKVEGMLKALKEKNASKAYSDYTSTAFQEVTSLEAFETFLDNYPVFVDYDSYEIIEKSIEQNVGKVKVNLISSNRLTTATFIFSLENGLWKMWTIEVQNPVL